MADEKFSVVIPCYKSDQTIEKVVRLTSEELDRLGIHNYEFILVNDCSPDGGKTVAAIKEAARKYGYVTAIDLAKNVGQHNAIMAALNYAEGDFIISMDDDMQTHPSQLSKLICEINKGYDVVYGYYPDKKHSLLRNFGSRINYWSSRLLIGKP
nr:glycosyltransferase [Bacillota bacterium]